MENNDLQSIYEDNYLVSNKNALLKEDVNSDEDDEDETPKQKASAKKKKKKSDDIGAITYNDSRSFNDVFGKLLREFDEGGYGDDDTFDADGGDDLGGDDTNEFSDEGEVSISKATIRGIIDQLQGLLGEGGDEFEDGDDEFDDGNSFDDDVPRESYTPNSGGKEKGDQGNYDGKARKQGPSKFVKANGDTDFSDQDTGYKPEDTEGSEGKELGAQGNYDGKARKQGPTANVKGNGDTNFGRSKTGYGKKEKEDLY